ncbi:MAG: hypothetical protein OSB29_04580 [Verrucomicrobiota bacterium]|nr:hypothetical protein [Verrucomicrobiota bacterium]
MIRSLIFSMLIFGLWELSPAAVSVGGQQQQAQKKQVAGSEAGLGQNPVQLNNTSQSSNAKTQTLQTTKTKQVKKPKAKEGKGSEGGSMTRATSK